MSRPALAVKIDDEYQPGIHKAGNWDYKQRHTAQEIMPYLYLGPMAIAKDVAFLKEHKFTMALAIRPKKGSFMQGAMNKLEEMGIEVYSVDVETSDQLVKTFPEANDLLVNHFASYFDKTGETAKALIFCESGNDRSAAITAAFLMAVHDDVDFVKAIQICQCVRFCCNFDDTLKRQLQLYDDLLQAQRPPTYDDYLQRAADERFARKRGHEEAISDSQDADMDLDDAQGDHDRFTGRVSKPDPTQWEGGYNGKSE